MTAAAGIVTGARIRAADARNVYPQAVIKTVDQNSNGTTMTNDAELFITAAASATYLFACYLDYEGDLGGNGSMQFEWLVPSSAVLRFAQLGKDASGSTLISSTGKDTTVYTAQTNGAGVLQAIVMYGTLLMGTAAGTLQLKWAQNTPSATVTKVHAQSFIALWQVSP